MEQNFDSEYWKQKPCPKYDCRKNSCKCGLERVFLSTALGDDSEGSPVAPENGAYCNAVVVYEANGNVYLYSKEGIPTLVSSEGNVDELIDSLEKELRAEVSNRREADDTLQTEIDNIKNSPDVVDIVPTYAALQSYDTSGLGDKDIVRVLADETHDGNSTYYRWNATTSSWTFIGTTGPYYTKTQTDALLDEKQDTLEAGDGINITGNVISAISTGGGGIAKVLTADDYNWPVSNPDGVALWLLDSGLYTVTDSSVKVYTRNGYSQSFYRVNTFLVANGINGNNSNLSYIYLFVHDATSLYKDVMEYSIINRDTGGQNASGQILTSYFTYDGLNSYSAVDPLSANQGRILNSNITAIHNRLGGLTLVSISQTDYDALTTKDPHTLYVITGA